MPTGGAGVRALSTARTCSRLAPDPPGMRRVNATSCRGGLFMKLGNEPSARLEGGGKTRWNASTTALVSERDVGFLVGGIAKSPSAAIAGPKLRVDSAFNAILDNRVRLVADLTILRVLDLKRDENHDAKGDQRRYQPQRDRICFAGSRGWR
jgi:hypothetical protein